jgi:hypothetical protein
MLDQLARQVVDLAHAPGRSKTDLQAAVQKLFDALRQATAAQAAAVLATIASAIEASDDERASFIALVCGALVERGLKPDAMAEPLLKRLKEAVDGARRLYDAIAIDLGNDPDERSASFT